MFPALPSHNGFNKTFRHSIQLGELLPSADSTEVLGSYFKNLRLRQYSSWMSFSYVMSKVVPAFVVSIFGVIRSRTQKQMVWPNALRVVTPMQNAKTGVMTVMQEPRNPVGAFLTPSTVFFFHFQLPVPEISSPACPLPTAVRLTDLTPKSLIECLHSRHNNTVLSLSKGDSYFTV